jgi:two-component system, NarL family, sensor kinase
MDDKEIIFLVFSASITILLISIGLMLFLLFFVRTSNKNFKEKIKLKEKYEKELYSTQMEIKDQTLRYVGQELHDNIGQLLTVTRIHLKELLKTIDNDKLAEVNNIAGKALEELRLLSKSLNKGEFAKKSSFTELVEQEMQLIEKTGVIKAHLIIEGIVYNFDKDHELICFRIIQEFMSNALKYSGCENLYFKLNYQPQLFSLQISDDGKGFDKNNVIKGNGLINIENRAQMIGANYQLLSESGRGTKIILNLKTNQNDTV